jgi:6-phosphofructokinase 1
MNHSDFIVKSLGNCHVTSPLKLSQTKGDGVFDYVNDDDRILMNNTLKNLYSLKENDIEPISFEKAGPREKLYFEPAKTKAAIVTCGGLCPGLNNVIRSLVMELFHRYSIKNIIGIKYGYEGFIPSYNHSYIELNPENVSNIHSLGGTILGSSRGMQDVSIIVDELEKMNINILFCIGGDGTLKGANAIYEEIEKRNLKISICGIPKTIDNDIGFIEKSFGFETAFSIAQEIIKNAHNEATGAYNGIALIKLMGRDSGFIAANAALSTLEVNFVLIPEIEFELYGEKGFLNQLEKRLEKRNHALIVIAEGAGQNFFKDSAVEYDASGNVRHKDIGTFLKEKIKIEFEAKNIPFSIKYIDPSYIIRSAPANANDSKFCSQLAQNAVHAALAGKTDFVVGYWSHEFVLLPIPVTISKRKKVDIESELWWNVLEVTGQPMSMKNSK